MDESQLGEADIKTGFFPELADSSLPIRFTGLNLASGGTPFAIPIARAVSQQQKKSALSSHEHVDVSDGRGLDTRHVTEGTNDRMVRRLK